MQNIKQAELLYNSISTECSTLITQRYSTSFSLGIKLLPKRFHNPIYAVYGFVRIADEIVDTFHQHDKKIILQKLKKDTYDAIQQKMSPNPILHAFQLVVHKYNMEKDHIEAFFNSMSMDLSMSIFNVNEYKTYIYGSAEVIGLMCLHVFVDGDDNKYQELKPYAKSLGSAFQKVNFLRDISADYHKRGRVYFPSLDIKRFDDKDKKILIDDVNKDFENALIGIKKLPNKTKKGVYLAFKYFITLLKNIEKTSAKQLLKKRIKVSNIKKIALLIKTLLLN